MYPYVLENEWGPERLTRLPDEITDSGIELLALERDHLNAGGTLQRKYASLNYFDGIHLGTASVRGEPITSTDTLYPDLDEVESVDPREL